VKILLDENLHEGLIEPLRRLGHIIDVPSTRPIVQDRTALKHRPTEFARIGSLLEYAGPGGARIDAHDGLA
jgi:hypothetical protein